MILTNCGIGEPRSCLVAIITPYYRYQHTLSCKKSTLLKSFHTTREYRDATGLSLCSLMRVCNSLSHTLPVLKIERLGLYEMMREKKEDLRRFAIGERLADIQTPSHNFTM